MEIINELLGVPKLKIVQNPEMLNFSIDSILLAHFATIKKTTKKIVDLGCGNAPIPLYLSLRTKSSIIGVEIQKKSYDLAIKSVKINNVEEQITILNDNLIDIHKKIGKNTCELVTCNPPFFKYLPTSNVNKNDFLTIARHEVLVNLEEIIKEASYLLNNCGYFAMVHRPERLTEIILLLQKYHLSPRRIQFIYPKEGANCKHVLIESKKTHVIEGLKILPPLIVHTSDNRYSKEILKIYNCEEE